VTLFIVLQFSAAVGTLLFGLCGALLLLLALSLCGAAVLSTVRLPAGRAAARD
jgi:hypothetical protein